MQQKQTTSLQKLDIVACPFFFSSAAFLQQKQTTSWYKACHRRLCLPLYLLLTRYEMRQKQTTS